MKWAFEFSRSAEAELGKLPRDPQIRLLNAIVRLAKSPFEASNVKKLKGADFYRLRIGDYRVLYSIDSDRSVVRVEGIRHRREAYR